MTQHSKDVKTVLELRSLRDRIEGIRGSISGLQSAVTDLQTDMYNLKNEFYNGTVWESPTTWYGNWVHAFVNQPLRFQRRGGMCYIEGTIKDGDLNWNAFLLPSGYRPSSGYVVYHSIVANGALGYMTVAPDGLVKIYAASNVRVDICASWAVAQGSF